MGPQYAQSSLYDGSRKVNMQCMPSNMRWIRSQCFRITDKRIAVHKSITKLVEKLIELLNVDNVRVFPFSTVKWLIKKN